MGFSGVLVALYSRTETGQFCLTLCLLLQIAIDVIGPNITTKKEITIRINLLLMDRYLSLPTTYIDIVKNNI